MEYLGHEMMRKKRGVCRIQLLTSSHRCTQTSLLCWTKLNIARDCCTLLHTAAYYCTLLHSAADWCKLLHSNANYCTLHCCTLLQTAANYFTLLHTTAHCCTLLQTLLGPSAICLTTQSFPAWWNTCQLSQHSGLPTLGKKEINPWSDVRNNSNRAE